MSAAGVMTVDHDPGADGAAARVDDIPNVAAEPIASEEHKEETAVEEIAAATAEMDKSA